MATKLCKFGIICRSPSIGADTVLARLGEGGSAERGRKYRKRGEIREEGGNMGRVGNMGRGWKYGKKWEIWEKGGNMGRGDKYGKRG